jgi:gliding motility-associated lipoprotein GldH
MSSIFSHFGLFFSLLLFTACGDRPVFESTKQFEQGIWMYRDTVNFDFNIADTSARYDLGLVLQHAVNYPNQNIYVRLKTKFPDGRRVTDVQSFDFFDQQGKALGKCSGNGCSLESELQKNTKFRQAGNYVLTVEQWMRRDSLAGIEQITLSVAKAK